MNEPPSEPDLTAPVARNMRRYLNDSPVLRAIPGGAQHGERSLYVRGCRCDLCRDAQALYDRTRAAKTRRTRKTCRHGHAYTPANTIYDRNGWRRCRKCSRAPRRRRPACCPHGHRWTPQNTYVDPRGRRRCRACKRSQARRANEKRTVCRCYKSSCPECREAGRRPGGRALRDLRLVA